MNQFDQRYVKRKGDKFATSTGAFEEGRSLCAVCTKNATCNARSTIALLTQAGYGAEMRNCEEFGVAIPFDSDTGVFSKMVNTFRIGTGMVNRLVAGNEITLVDNKSGVVIRRAKVTDIDVGPLDKMVRKHGSNNHLVKGYDDSDEARKFLAAYINRTYGPHMTLEGKKDFSVVYFK